MRMKKNTVMLDENFRLGYLFKWKVRVFWEKKMETISK